MVDMRPITSSNLLAVGYDRQTAELVIEFRGGGKYHYRGVPPDLHADLINAKSPGQTFRDKILGKYDHHQPEAPP